MRALALGFLLFVLPGLASASGMERGGDELAFAESLFDEGDYYRAITEYKRFLFQRPASALEPWVRFRIGESYLKGGRYTAAFEIFEQLQKLDAPSLVKEQAWLMGARSLYLDGRYPQALAQLDLRKSTGEADYLGACILLRSHRPEEARQRLVRIPTAHTLASKALDLSASLKRAQKLPHKSPALAGVLSLVPGLGHIYLEQYSIGLTAFVWNGVFGFATYEAFRKEQYGVGALLACLELLWYSGTIYGAVNGAERYNDDAWKNYVDDLDATHGLDLPDTGQKNLGLILQGSY